MTDLRVRLGPEASDRDGTPGSGILLALDPDVWAAALGNGATRGAGGTLLGPADVLPDTTAIDSIDATLAAAWSAATDLAPRGASGRSLFDVVGYRHVRWIQRVAAIATVVDAACRVVRPRHLLLEGPPRGHLLDRPLDAPSMPALAAVAAAIGAARGLVVRYDHDGGVEPSASEPPPGGEGMTPPVAVRDEEVAGSVLLIADAAERRFMGAVLGSLRTVGVGTRLLCHGRVDRSDVDAGAVDGFIGTRSPVPVDEAALAHAREAFEAAALAGGGLAAELVEHGGLRSHLDFLVGPYASRVAATDAAWARALTRARPAAVVGAYPSPGLEVAATMGVPAILLPHGPMMGGTERYHLVLPPEVRLVAVGHPHAAQLRSIGLPAHRIVATGMPGAAPDADARTNGSDRPGDRRPVLLVPTVETSRPVHLGVPPTVWFDREFDVLVALARAAIRRGWRVRLRPHPRYDRGPAYHAALRAAVGDEANDGLLIDGGDRPPLEQAVADAEAIVFPGAPTSAIPEMARLGVPALVLTAAAGRPFVDRWGLTRFPAAATVDDCMDRLDSARSDAQARRHLVAAAQAAAADFLVSDDGGIVDAVLEAAGRFGSTGA